MARFRLSERAKADIASILRASAAQHGREASRRYNGLLAATFRRIAADPQGHPTVERSELGDSMRSLHVRFCRDDNREGVVKAPVHLVLYRLGNAAPINIVGVVHERRDLSRYIKGY